MFRGKGKKNTPTSPPQPHPKINKETSQRIKMTFLYHVRMDDKASCFASFREKKDILQTNLVYKQAAGFCLKHSRSKVRGRTINIAYQNPLLLLEIHFVVTDSK